MDSKGCLLTQSGRYIDPLHVRPGDVLIEDVAYGLSNQPRFVGQTRYTIAEHSVRVSLAIESAGHGAWAAFWGLLHDASEYLLTDLPRTLKYLPEFAAYREIEARAEHVCGRAFGLIVEGEAYDPPAVVKEYDRVLLATERRDLLPHDGTIDGEPAGYDYGFAEYVGDVVPLPFPIEPWSREAARKRFLERYDDLAGRLGRHGNGAASVIVHRDPGDETSAEAHDDASEWSTPVGEILGRLDAQIRPLEPIALEALEASFPPLPRLEFAEVAGIFEIPVEESVCAEADRIVSDGGERTLDYGHPLDNFQRIADGWFALLPNDARAALEAIGYRFDPEFVGRANVWTKLARDVNAVKRDNYVDTSGYAKTLDMIRAERARRSSQG